MCALRVNMWLKFILNIFHEKYFTYLYHFLQFVIESVQHDKIRTVLCQVVQNRIMITQD